MAKRLGPVVSLWRGENSTPPPAPGLEWYAVDEHYWVDTRRFPRGLASRVVSKCLARWADRFEVTDFDPFGGRSVQLPEDASERVTEVDRLFDAYEDAHADGTLIPLVLFQGERCLLDMHDYDGPHVLALSSDEFAELQDALERNNLPRDLYYRGGQRRDVLEPATIKGSTFLWLNRYSPLRWAHRDPSARSALRVPDFRERDQRFFNACRRFESQLGLRKFEALQHTITEKAQDSATREELERALVEVMNRLRNRLRSVSAT